MKILIPSEKFFQEYSYLFNLVFKNFLKTPYELKICSRVKNPTIVLSTGKRLIFEQCFFSHSIDPNEPQTFALPDGVIWVEAFNLNIPVFYGTGLFKNLENDYILTADILGMIFFMVTRWEDSVSATKDKYGRSQALDSFAYKNNFLHLPVVDYYVRIIAEILLTNGQHVDTKKLEKHKLFLTHDLDHLRSLPNIKAVLRRFLGNIFISRKLKRGLQAPYLYFKYKNNSSHDPFYDLEWLMDISEKHELKSIFYFLVSNKTSHDNQIPITEDLFLNTVRLIKNRGHKVGYHPSFESSIQKQIWMNELKEFEDRIGFKVSEGRQHYLRINIPETLEWYNESGFKIDSTLGYHDMLGYRCGTGKKFPVFNFVKRTTLNVNERPLIIMDGTLFDYMKCTPEESLQKIHDLGPSDITVLWHNGYPNFKETYPKWVDLLKEKLDKQS